VGIIREARQILEAGGGPGRDRLLGNNSKFKCEGKILRLTRCEKSRSLCGIQNQENDKKENENLHKIKRVTENRNTDQPSAYRKNSCHLKKQEAN